MASSPLRRIAALTVTITLVAVPIASAQSPEAGRSGAAAAPTPLLSPTAFARLIQPPPADVAPAGVVAETPRPSLLRQAMTAVARQAQAAPTKPQQEKSWAARHPGAVGAIILGGVLGAIYIFALFMRG